MKDTITNFIDSLKKNESLAIIGLSKNAGKTTTLNSVLKLLNYKDVMLTSIGYDGEETDLVFGTDKPTIFVEKGCVIATAKKCVLNSDIRFEILDTTGFNTPLGEIIIVKCLESGLIELAGPSYNAQLLEVIKLLKSYDDGLVIVDGALNRKTFSDPSVCDQTILCSGMTISDDVDEVVKITLFAYEMLSLKEVVKEDKELLTSLLDTPLSVVDKDLSYRKLDLPSAINQEAQINKELDKDSKYLMIDGPLTDKLAVNIIRNRKNISELTIIVKNGTNVFIKEETYNQLAKAKIDLRVLNGINVCAISINPTGLYKKYDSNEIVAKLQEKSDVFVCDFVGGE